MFGPGRRRFGLGRGIKLSGANSTTGSGALGLAGAGGAGWALGVSTLGASAFAFWALTFLPLALVDFSALPLVTSSSFSATGAAASSIFSTAVVAASLTVSAALVAASSIFSTAAATEASALSLASSISRKNSSFLEPKILNVALLR